MKQKRKVKGQKFTESNKFLASLLVLLGGAFCMGALSLFTVPNVWGQTSLTTLSYTGLESKNEVVYDMFFIDKGNQEIINEIYMKKDGDNRNFYISGNSVVLGNLLPNYEGLDKVSVLNLVGEGKYSNILGGDHNNINSSNITIIAGVSNAISEGNDNATIVGSAGSNVSTGGGNVPLVLVGGSNNEIGSNQNGTVIIGGNGNKIFDNVSNSQILGGNGNKVAVDNVIVAGNNVEATPSGEGSFVFNGYSTEVFRPNSTNSFFLNVEKGVGLNMEASNGGLASKGAISIGEIDKSMCTSDNIGMQGVLSGCLVGCTKEGILELLDTSERCLELLPGMRKIKPPKPQPFPNAGVCDSEGVDTGNATICGDPTGYVNAIFEVELIDAKTDPDGRSSGVVCPNGDNQCVYQCNDGYHLVDGKCYKDCALDGKIIKHKESGVWYNTNGTRCTDTCPEHSKTLRCDNGTLYDDAGNKNGNGYENANCSLSEYRCSLTEYPLSYSDLEESKGHYSSCTDYNPVGNDQCKPLTPLHYKLDYCYSDYTRVGNKCYKKCSYTSSYDTDHGDHEYPYHNSGGTCSSSSDGCSTYLVTCNNGTWKIGNGNINAGTLITSCWWEGQPCEGYNISESEKVEGKVYSSCQKFSGGYSCSAGDVVYQEGEGCEAGYRECGGDCIPDCTEGKPNYNSCSCVDETYSCGGTEPSGDGVSKGSSSYTEGHTPTSWTYKSSGTLGACQWRCSDGYEQSGNGCKEKEKSICALSCGSVFDSCRVDGKSAGDGSNQEAHVNTNAEGYYTWQCFLGGKPSGCDEVDPNPPLSCRCDTKTCSDYELSSTNPGDYESVTKDSGCGSEYKIVCYKPKAEYHCQGTQPGSYTTESSDVPTSDKNWEYKSSGTLGACQWRCQDSNYERDGSSTNCKPKTYTCGGTQPSGDGVSKGATTYTYGNTPTSWTYKSSGTLGNCEWKCDSNYEKDGDTGCKYLKYTCEAGKYLPANSTSCASCTAGNYCPGGTWSKSSSDQGINQCSCGTYSKSGASSCTNCGAGKWSEAGSSSCSNISCGYYGSSACSATPNQCDSGKYSNEGSSECSSCGEGEEPGLNQCTCMKKFVVFPQCGSAHEKAVEYIPEGKAACTIGSMTTDYPRWLKGKHTWTCENEGKTVDCWACGDTYTVENGNCVKKPDPEPDPDNYEIYDGDVSCSYNSSTYGLCNTSATCDRWDEHPNNEQEACAYRSPGDDCYGDYYELNGTNSEYCTCSASNYITISNYCNTTDYQTYCNNHPGGSCIVSVGSCGGIVNYTRKTAMCGDGNCGAMPTINSYSIGGTTTLKYVQCTNSGGGDTGSSGAGSSSGGGCFLAGTQVYMADGTTKNIEDIEVGEMVLTYNTETKQNEYNKVLKKYVHENNTDNLYEFTINGNVLTVTAPHRFYVVLDENDGYKCPYNWVPASRLKVGYDLLMYDGSIVTIEDKVRYSHYGTVYNLLVENNNNYYVAEGYLVHNLNGLNVAGVQEFSNCGAPGGYCGDNDTDMNNFSLEVKQYALE